MTNIAQLAGLRVLDLSHTAPASACVQILAQLGADIETFDSSQAALASLGSLPDSEVIVTDHRWQEGRSISVEFVRLTASSRVVVVVSPFGLDNENVERTDLQAINGELDSVSAAALSGAHAAVASLGALRWARHHGRTVYVDVATLEVLAACQGDLLPQLVCPRHRNADMPAAFPELGTTVLQCEDGYVALNLPTQAHREDLAALTGIDGLRDTDANIARLLAPWLQKRTRYEIFHLAQLWRLPLVPVLKSEEVVEDEQNMARQVWSRDKAGNLLPRSPFRFVTSTTGARKPAAPDSLPLSDIHVLDLGVVWAGPYCSRLLAGLGARVTRIERPARMLDRDLALRDGCWGVLGDFNRAKASLVLDLRSAAGQSLFIRLARAADVVIENFSPRVMPNLGIGYRQLIESNPGLLMLSMPAFGTDGPWADYVTYGSGLELVTGLALQGADGDPTPATVPYLDYLVACYGAAGLLSALLARDKSGPGLHLEVAQREVACQVLGMCPNLDVRRNVRSPDPIKVVRNPYLARRRFLTPARQSKRACYHLARLPWRLNGVPSRPEQAARPVGADTRRIMRDILRLNRDEIETHIRNGTIETASRRS